LKQKPKLNILDVEDITKLLDVLQETPYFVYYCLLLYTGLRRGEALALRWKNVDLNNGKLQVEETVYRLHDGEYLIKEPKTKHSKRSVSLPESMRLLLMEYRGEQERLFTDIGQTLSPENFMFVRIDNGLPFDPDSLTKTFSKAIRKTELPHIRLHDLRHTHATLMLRAGIHPKIVSERLGHANIGITLDTYSTQNMYYLVCKMRQLNVSID
jgi:integrase